jgi:acetate kinase
MNGYLLIINVGSTSIKSKLFTCDFHIKAELTADYGTDKGLNIQGTDLSGKSISQTSDTAHDANAALPLIFERWQKLLETSEEKLLAIGHRVVHGASWFQAATLVDAAMLERLNQLDDYAPLHNPFNRLGLTIGASVFPKTPQFAVFDTAFHRHIPDFAGRYAIPENLSDIAFYRYGFHGLSCQHSLNAAAKLLTQKTENLNLIILHLGGGCSATAVRGGISVDTSMGFSPTEGLIMAGRSGDLDPMILVSLQKTGMSPTELDDLLNHNSGLKGICGDADMRSILHKAEQGEAAASLALEMFCYRIKKYIGAYSAVLGEVSALIFTGGIGEHAPLIRSKILANLEPLGFVLNEASNTQTTTQNCDISTANSRSRILVIAAEEERVCAEQILAAFS